MQLLSVRKQIQRLIRTVPRLMAVFAAAVIIAAAVPAAALAQAAGSNNRAGIFAEAAAEFSVPKELLLAISYNQSRFENHKGEASASGGYGLMHLTAEVEHDHDHGRGDSRRPAKRAEAKARYTLREAAKQLGVAEDQLKKNDKQNVRGAASLLVKYAKEANGGMLPVELEGWYAAVARLQAVSDVSDGREFADDVYQTIRDGVTQTTTDKQVLRLEKRAVAALDETKLKAQGVPERTSLLETEASYQAECPPTISCRFVPARFAQNTADPLDYGNYDTANRPRDMKIKYIVIHDTEGSYQSAIDWFKDPRSYVAAHYVIRSADGEVTQMVQNKDVGWHAGNWYVNMHSIGIEHEGWAAEGATWYTEAMYRSSAKLVRYLADKYNIPMDREHIIGHDQYHALRPDRVAGMHYDPGPYWDWDHYMNLLHAPTVPTAGPDSKLVTIAPRFSENKPEVTECESDICTTLPTQGANFVYLRTSPQHNAPLLSDAGLHPDGAPGTTRIEDWSAKAIHGQHFAVAEQRAEWTAIWFGGQKGWFYNPAWSWDKRTALPFDGKLVTPRPGMSEIPVYGRPLPEASAYHSGVPVQPILTLQYRIKANQTYYAYDNKAKNDYYHVLAFDRSTPGDGEMVIGDEKYIPISYNHRQAYVKASDVRIVHD
jgi:N-acetyl-anhydromuramyl-L-alanine amidase AmpD